MTLLGAHVSLAGYAGAALEPEIANHRRIHVRRFAEPRLQDKQCSVAVLLIRSMLRVGYEHLLLFGFLTFSTPRPQIVLVQNPRRIPILLVGLLTARRRGAKLIVDWHNFGYSMLGLKLGATHIVVRLYRWYEQMGMAMRTAASAMYGM